MRVYLDNSATTALREEVIETIENSLREDFGNPSSLHRLGFEMEKKIRASRQAVARALNADEKEIYFTSGATYSC